MINIFFVEKKEGFNVEADVLLRDFRENLLIQNLDSVRVLNKYIAKGENLNKIEEIIFEPTVDFLYKDSLDIKDDDVVFATEYLPGQYDQRADAAIECFAILNNGRRINLKTSKVMVLSGDITQEDVDKIKKYYINPVDSREVDYLSCELNIKYDTPKKVKVLDGFIDFNREMLKEFLNENSLAMSINDISLIQEYFKGEKRNPTVTEIKVIDTYWSDHCRHTTFETAINSVEFEEGKYTKLIKETFNKYLESREFVYENRERPVTLMDLAVISMKEMRKRGILDDLDLSDEINACSINVKIETDDGEKDYVLMFKNETHNHPTEIEPFGGAATCLGGAIRDPLSGRTYVYQAMRITGSGNPTVDIKETLDGKLPQRKITLGAAHGYSSYGNQIGLATGEVREVYHDGYIAKRMEVGAVLGAAPKENIVREKPAVGDMIILLGGKTGRDGCGGATGSSKEHDEFSIENCGAEVQKGNPPTERKIQRLFRNSEATKLIKKCNDFGAGGVSVAIGELCDSLDIYLDLVPKKYEGLDGTELAISESQERMAVVISDSEAKKFIEFSNLENLEATIVAKVTDTGYMRMIWQDEVIVDLKREFLDTNGARANIDIIVKEPKEKNEISEIDIESKIKNTLKDLNVGIQKGLIERFDSTIGTGSVLMPLGGKRQITPSEGMACKIPVLDGYSKTASLMTAGLNPYISEWSPFHGAYYSVIESVARLVALGGDYKKVRLTFQEYFERLGTDATRWGKPLCALLGAYKIQKELNIPAIGGKDSMSGSFKELDVPPTLVSFAVGTENSKNILSPEFKNTNSKVILLKTAKTSDELLDVTEFKRNMEKVHELNKKGEILAASSVKANGVFEVISKMAIGNEIGFNFSSAINERILFDESYGSFILELSNDFDLQNLDNTTYIELGLTNSSHYIRLNDKNYNLSEIEDSLINSLKSVFEFETPKEISNLDNISFKEGKMQKSKLKFEKPRVLIPVFPGTNCEYDTRKAFEKAGADVKEFVFRNLDAKSLEESLKRLEDEIKNTQIIMIPGGFSAGDEPDGSAKFIATVFRNANIKDAVHDLLDNRDGLILGICNGFQALIKLGLVPYGKIVDIDDTMPTLTYNNIGRHMSSIVRTRIVSNKSPWLTFTNISDIYNVPISHGEGRFVASDEVLNTLIENGQVATQYVDLNGNATMNMPYNPNGSVMAVEGITSIDGRVFGKMGHSERVGENLYKNVIGEYESKIFEAGVNYFK